jgi:hypothetical protein
MTEKHISHHDLERYHIGMVCDETELCAIEQHLIGCEQCVRRAEETADYIDLTRTAIIILGFDLESSDRKGVKMRTRVRAFRFHIGRPRREGRDGGTPIRQPRVSTETPTAAAPVR